MFEQRGRGRQRRGDGVDGGDGLRRGRVPAGVVLEGEERTEAPREGHGLGREGLSEGQDLLRFGRGVVVV